MGGGWLRSVDGAGHARRVAGAPRLELVADALADPADGRVGQGGFASKDLSQGGLDVAVGQAAHPAREQHVDLGADALSGRYVSTQV